MYAMGISPSDFKRKRLSDEVAEVFLDGCALGAWTFVFVQCFSKNSFAKTLAAQ
jgi:hypothetical protein